MEPAGRLLVIVNDNPGGGRLFRVVLKEYAPRLMFPEAAARSQALVLFSGNVRFADRLMG